MRILVAASLEAGSSFAHAIHTVQMAHGFASLGHDVTLVCMQSRRRRVPEETLRAQYGLTAPIRWLQLPQRVFGRKVEANGNFGALALLAGLRVRPQILYARNYILPCWASTLRLPTVAESHAHPDNRSKPFLALVRASHNRAFRLWVTIAETLADHYRSLGVPAEKLAVLPDAVETARFRRPGVLPPNPFRSGVGEPGRERPDVVYAGHLYDYKGIPSILDAAGKLPDVNFHLVGGWPEDIETVRARIVARRLENVTLHGLKTHAEVPTFLWHADILLLPPSARHPSAAWTSPLKLGEYLASGTPVVATSIPALNELLDGDEVRFCEPDSGAALAAQITSLLNEPESARKLALRGLHRAESLSYARRARAVLERAVGGTDASSR